jgi:acyl phosphate:glycerol-3-phosphate acyltransferase
MIPTLAVPAGYLLGSIPTSVLVTRALGGFDIRSRGSGSAGGTNVLRTLGWMPALLVAVVDVGKGFLAVALARALGAGAAVEALAAGAAIAGHVWPLFASFRGGKGVATAAGAFLALQPLAVAASALVFFPIVFLSRIVSVASMSAGVALPLALAWMRWGMDRPVPDPVILLAAALAVFVLWTHRANVARLRQGTEPRIRPGGRAAPG